MVDILREMVTDCLVRLPSRRLQTLQQNSPARAYHGPNGNLSPGMYSRETWGAKETDKHDEHG